MRTEKHIVIESTHYIEASKGSYEYLLLVIRAPQNHRGNKEHMSTTQALNGDGRLRIYSC